MEHLEYVEKRALELSSAVGYLRGYLNGVLLYSDITPANFKLGYEALKQSYKLSDTEMNDNDVIRFKKRAEELGVKI